MNTRCAPACSQAHLVKPQGVWARGIEAWAGSRDLRNLEFRRWGSSGPSSLMKMWISVNTHFVPVKNLWLPRPLSESHLEAVVFSLQNSYTKVLYTAHNDSWLKILICSIKCNSNIDNIFQGQSLVVKRLFYFSTGSPLFSWSFMVPD